jgi:hypothetical protein
VVDRPARAKQANRAPRGGLGARGRWCLRIPGLGVLAQEVRHGGALDHDEAPDQPAHLGRQLQQEARPALVFRVAGTEAEAVGLPGEDAAAREATGQRGDAAGVRDDLVAVSSAGGEAVLFGVDRRLCPAYQAVLQPPVAGAAHGRFGVETTRLVVGPITIVVICRRQGHDPIAFIELEEKSQQQGLCVYQLQKVRRDPAIA